MLRCWIKSCICAAVLAAAMSPVSSFADKQDYDLADRVYEKFKEREKERGEQQKRSSGQQKKLVTTRRDEDQETQKSRSRERDEPKRNEPRREVRDDRNNSNNSEDRLQRNNDKRSDSRNDSRNDTRNYSRNDSSNDSSNDSRNDSRSNSRGDERPRNTVRQGYESTSRNNRNSIADREDEVREQVSLDQAVNLIRRRSSGKVVGAKTTGSGTRRQHRIKVLIDGSRVRTYIVSASTGEIY